MALSSGIYPGQIYSHDRFYCTVDGEWKRKYLLVLASSPGNDVIYKLLTSKAHGRTIKPNCSHSNPYPSFYLGFLGSPLTTNSWLDLRKQDDYDGVDFLKDINSGYVKLITSLNKNILCLALECVISADDTTRQQERAINNIRNVLGC